MIATTTTTVGQKTFYIAYILLVMTIKATQTFVIAALHLCYSYTVENISETAIKSKWSWLCAVNKDYFKDEHRVCDCLQSVGTFKMTSKRQEDGITVPWVWDWMGSSWHLN